MLFTFSASTLSEIAACRRCFLKGSYKLLFSLPVNNNCSFRISLFDDVSTICVFGFRSDQKLSLVGNPGQLLKPSQTETISCEYLALESMERWIICKLCVKCSILTLTATLKSV